MQDSQVIAAALRRALVRLAPAADGGVSLPPLPKADGGAIDVEDAVTWHRKRDRALTKDEWSAQGEADRQRSFTVANVAQLDLVHDAWKAIDKAIADGTTLDDFKKEVGPKLQKAWGGSVKNPATRVETIFRTNVQRAYNAGRWHAAKAAVETHPYWQLDVVLDGRTSGICRPVAGIVLRADDPWWKTNVPPRHFNCRATIRSLRERVALRLIKGGLPSDPKDAAPASGFGAEPTEQWKPDPTKYPDQLQPKAA